MVVADQGKWFKLWCTALSDAALEDLTPHEWYCWARLGCYIKAHGDTGTVTFVSPAYALTALFHVPTFGAAIAIVRRFPHCILEEGKSLVSGETNVIVSLKITYMNWLKYQGDYSTGRVRKFRARNRKSETPQEEKRGDVEEKRKEEMLRPPTSTALPSAFPSKSTATAPAKTNGALRPVGNIISTMRINGKPYTPEPEIPDEDRMTPEEMEAIRLANMPKPRAPVISTPESDVVVDEPEREPVSVPEEDQF